MLIYAVTCERPDGCGYDGGVVVDEYPDPADDPEGPTTCPWCGRRLSHDDVSRVERDEPMPVVVESPTGVPLPRPSSSSTRCPECGDPVTETGDSECRHRHVGGSP